MEKMLVTSIFSFSHNVFKRLLPQCHKKSGLCGKELTFKQTTKNLDQSNLKTIADNKLNVTE